MHASEQALQGLATTLAHGPVTVPRGTGVALRDVSLKVSARMLRRVRRPAGGRPSAVTQLGSQVRTAMQQTPPTGRPVLVTLGGWAGSHLRVLQQDLSPPHSTVLGPPTLSGGPANKQRDPQGPTPPETTGTRPRADNTTPTGNEGPAVTTLTLPRPPDGSQGPGLTGTVAGLSTR